MDGVVVIGEGEKDEAPMLFNGERIGTHHGVAVDVAVDPLEGTDAGRAAASRTRSRWWRRPSRARCSTPGPCVYMEKLACGADIEEQLDLDAPIEETLEMVARAKRGRVARPDGGHRSTGPGTSEMVGRIRAAGARIRFIPHGDVAGVDDGGHARHRHRPPVGHRRHARGRALGGGVQVPGRPARGRLWPRDDDEASARGRPGYDLDKVLTVDDLIRARTCSSPRPA